MENQHPTTESRPSRITPRMAISLVMGFKRQYELGRIDHSTFEAKRLYWSKVAMSSERRG